MPARVVIAARVGLCSEGGRARSTAAAAASTAEVGQAAGGRIGRRWGCVSRRSGGAWRVLKVARAGVAREGREVSAVRKGADKPSGLTKGERDGVGRRDRDSMVEPALGSEQPNARGLE